MGKEKRDAQGKIKDSLLQKIKSFWLGRKLRKGKVPRGRVVSMQEGALALSATQRGYMTELWGMLGVKIIRANGTVEDLGLVSVKKITTAFRDYIVDSLQNATTYPLDVFKYHGSGTGTAAESNTDTALGTEVESRVSGTQIEGASANIFKTVATITYSGTYSITEHGVFSAATSGTLMDRSVFTAIGVIPNDSIQFTYEATFNAEA